MELQTMPLRFRVWAITEERFLRYDDIYYKGCGEDERIDFDYLDMGLAREQYKDAWHDFIVSQDTGLRDKNGKSIYTGDVCFYAPYERYVSVFYRGGMVLIKILEFEEYYISRHLDDLEVVGNIWQNSDLLKEKQDEETN